MVVYCILTVAFFTVQFFVPVWLALPPCKREELRPVRRR